MFSRRGHPSHPDVLTPAEWRVVEHIRAGRTNPEIAEALDISVNTVRYHVSNVLAKTGLDDRRALAEWSGRPRRLPVSWPLPLIWLGGGTAAVTATLGIVWLIGTMWSVAEVDGRLVPAFDTRASSSEYVRYEAADLERSGLINAGLLLENAEGAPFEAMYRPGWVGVTTTEQAWVADSEVPGGAWGPGTIGYGWSSSVAGGFTKTLRDQRIFVTVSIMDPEDTGNFGLQRQLVQFG